MTKKFREAGIDILSQIRWGEHICAFYDSKDSLLKMLIPYFAAGLKNNEVCVWVLSEALTVKDAKEALSKRLNDPENFIKNEQLKIIEPKDLYENDSKFDSHKLISFWANEVKQARQKGFDGIRISGSGNWVRDFEWEDLCNYEKRANELIGSAHAIAICTYSFDKVGLPEILAVGVHHTVIVARQNEKYNIVKSPSYDSILQHFNFNGQFIE